jgi:YgiT-type zinc finger domain-containing protein
MTICPICNKGTLEKKEIREEVQGIFLGVFPAEVCNKCGESYTDSKTTKKILIAWDKKNKNK